jgi:hypothetical protein
MGNVSQEMKPMTVLNADLSGYSNLDKSSQLYLKIKQFYDDFSRDFFDSLTSDKSYPKQNGDEIIIFLDDLEAIINTAFKLRNSYDLFQICAMKEHPEIIKMGIRIGIYEDEGYLFSNNNSINEVIGEVMSAAARIQKNQCKEGEIWYGSSLRKKLDDNYQYKIIRSEKVTGEVIGLKSKNDLNLYQVEDTSFTLNNGKDISLLMKELVCFHQGSVFEYWFLASKKHQELKESFSFMNSIFNKNLLHQHRKSLKEYLLDGVTDNLQKSFEILERYFKAVKKDSFKGTELNTSLYIPPRLGVKMVDENEHLIDLARSAQTPKTRTNRKMKLGDSSAFHEDPYLVNDIFQLIIESPENDEQAYINPSLNNSKVKAIFAQGENVEPFDFDKWVTCWEDEKQNALAYDDPRNYYRSTLIIPITLAHNDISWEFEQKFACEEGYARNIFGYLCIDSIYPKHFDAADVNVGYIAADLISLYLLSMINYLNKSKTISCLDKKLK